MLEPDKVAGNVGNFTPMFALAALVWPASSPAAAGRGVQPLCNNFTLSL